VSTASDRVELAGYAGGHFPWQVESGVGSITLSRPASEAQAQAICMHTEDSNRAYEAFVAQGKPRFEGH